MASIILELDDRDKDGRAKQLPYCSVFKYLHFKTDASEGFLGNLIASPSCS
jgi:hypothetical protein